MSFSGVISSRFVSRLAGPVLIVVGLLGLSSCWVYSVEPLYEERSASPDPDLTFDQTLVGSWGQADEDCIWILTISAEEQRYALTMAPAPECKTSQKATAYEGHLVKVGSHRFLDVFPQSDEVCDLCLPLHSFLLVSQEADRLALIPVEHDWLWQAMQEQKVGLPIFQPEALTTP